MTVSSQLWQANQDLVEACLKHPFVEGIADGSLSEQQFAYYVGQDAFFLESFARAYSIAAAKAPDHSGFRVFHELAGGVLEELQLHQGYAKSWGVDLQAVEPAAATRRYTDFLLATAWSRDVGMTAIAMIPCMDLYCFLGQELAKDGIPSHKYADWIRTYSSLGLAQLAQRLSSLGDRYAMANVNPELHSTYRYAMLCEHDFFQGAWEIGDL